MKISVVVPAYNAAAVLPRCLAALARQTRAPDEVIVVDDGSVDGTYDAAVGAGVCVLRQENQGPAAARNVGIAHATGDVILFTDADCVPAEDWVSQMASSFEDPAVKGVKGTYRISQPEVVAQIIQYEFEDRYERLARKAEIDFVDTYSAGFRAAALRAVGGFDTGFPQADNEDVDLAFRLAQAGYKLVFNPRAVVGHQHPSNWLTYFRLKVKRAYWRMIVYRLHPQKAVTDSYTPQLLKIQIGLAGLTGLGLILALFLPGMVWLGASAGVLLLAAAFPFALRVAETKPALVFWAVFSVVLRAFAFGIGVSAGLVGMWFFRPEVSREAG